MKSQRLRIRYRITSAAGSISNRDLVAAWESSVARAGLTLSFSEGRRPSPQISLAAPLPLGVTSDYELADIFLDQPTDPKSALPTLGSCLPQGIEALEIQEVGVDGPSLQSQLRRAEYRAVLGHQSLTVDELQERAATILTSDSLPVEYVRVNKMKAYDLRPLILSLNVSEDREVAMVFMRLRAEQENTARADQVLLALGVEGETQIHRTRLELDDVPAALLAYRRAGEPTGAELA